ncbi:hypothetical protein DAPPUDRAFT_277176 [Daphnia pulex]|uniref:Uncharacterized protein n=1 Tax=Daphnia pulex TaxID=6669 RepID=E9I688_DAPPU|nr:hypothetical protein DAPPUDRAFT_277176 [Daphnia pulex]|eukprot:EFX60492.1 hypothetical protein DAPPUDRAFT_277176 [Daphnia pulex]
MAAWELADRVVGVLPAMPRGQLGQSRGRWGGGMDQQGRGRTGLGRIGRVVGVGALGEGGGHRNQQCEQCKAGEPGACLHQAGSQGMGKRGAHGDLQTAKNRQCAATGAPRKRAASNADALRASEIRRWVV